MILPMRRRSGRRIVTEWSNAEKASDRFFVVMLFCIFCAIVLTFAFATAAFADGDDPIAVVNKRSDFIFGLIRAVDIILPGFGVLQLGPSLKSHAPSQRANGMLPIAGGIVITFPKEILNLITG